MFAALVMNNMTGSWPTSDPLPSHSPPFLLPNPPLYAPPHAQDCRYLWDSQLEGASSILKFKGRVEGGREIYYHGKTGDQRLTLRTKLSKHKVGTKKQNTLFS